MRVVHLFLDEPGGGPGHVQLLCQTLNAQVEPLGLSPSLVSSNPLGWIQARALISRKMREFQPSILHAHGVRAAAAACIAGRRRGVRRAVTIHGLHSLRRNIGFKGHVITWLNRRVLRRMDLVLAISESDRQTIIDRRLAHDDRVRVIRPAFEAPALIGRDVARDILGLGEDEVVVLWLARFSPQKDPMTFAASLPSLPISTGFRYLLVGDGELLPRVRATLRGKEVEGHTIFAGWATDTSVYMSASDIFVSTALWEGLPMAVLEAASAGLALVLTDAPGNRDIVDAGVPAVQVPQANPTELAKGLQRLLEDASLRNRIGTEAKRIVSATYSTENLASDVLDAYKELEHASR